MDSDEYIIEGHRSELERIANKGLIGKIKIINNFIRDNQEMSTTEIVSRFFPKGVVYTGCIHEQLDTELNRTELNLIVKHDGYYGTNKSKRNIPLLLKALNHTPDDAYYLFQLGKELRIDEQYEKAFSVLMKSYELSEGSYSFYNELILEIIYSGKELGKEEVINIINYNELKLKHVTDFHFAKGLFILDFLLKFPKTNFVNIQMIENSFLTCIDLSEKAHKEYVQGTSSYLATYNLGVYYEITKDLSKAINYYKLSAKYSYSPAQKRLDFIQTCQNEIVDSSSL
ncbi:hypothetical protein [Metabacillus sp. 84]|uniref:tetratricopeptide repeat protein n=1 Tax=Metabacillus sp. 84 TaxID=3404705 RepID=UPI003CEEE52B